MTSALTADQRTALERIVGKARKVLEEDLASRAAGIFGIDADGTIADEDALRLDPAALADRREVIDVINHLRSEGNAPADAVARLIREAVFTHLNRLVAIRIAESLQLLPPSISDGRRSQGFRDVQELAPLLLGDETGGYWVYLRLCGDELAGDVPTLFDPRNPLLGLVPSATALDELVELLADPAHANLWVAPDCLGWVYQFFNTSDERRSMREGSPAPRNSRELAVRNQFFTPRYVVDFLVQNSLGRLLLASDPSSAIRDDLPFLIDSTTESREPIDLAKISVLDPACGSGHFLIAAYDLLERAWDYAGVSPRDAAGAIVGSLWGIEIDPRCVQVAAAAVMFRARRSCPLGELPRPNIVCARSIPSTAGPMPALLDSLQPNLRDLVVKVGTHLASASTLGSLLKVDEHLQVDLRATVFGAPTPQGSLVDALPAEFFERLETDLIAALHQMADATTATPAERLLAAEAEDAIRFVDAVQRRYDVVLMNPPFGLAVEETRPYLQRAYGSAAGDLYAAFVMRGLELLRPGGLLGAITNRTGFFLSSLEEWRRQLLQHGVVTFADLGSFVLEGAQVEVAAYVVGRRVERTTFVRALLVRDKAAVLRELRSELTFVVSGDDLLRLPGAWFDYWAGDQALTFFSDLPPLQSDSRVVSRGLSAGDNFWFLRLLWELPPDARTRGWRPVSKGGEFARFYDDVHLLIDWRDGARPYADVGGARIFNLEATGSAGRLLAQAHNIDAIGAAPGARDVLRGEFDSLVRQRP